jgi:hypothetical protein
MIDFHIQFRRRMRDWILVLRYAMRLSRVFRFVGLVVSSDGDVSSALSVWSESRS